MTTSPARDGDPTAFADLVSPHRDAVATRCYLLLASVVDAEDALAEVLQRAFDEVAGSPEDVRGWLLALADEVCAERAGEPRPHPDPWPGDVDVEAVAALQRLPFAERLASQVAAGTPVPPPEGFAEAWENGDLSSVLAEDVVLVTPPEDEVVSGREAVLAYTASRVFTGEWEVAEVPANGTTAFACYQEGELEALVRVRSRDGLAVEIAAFMDPAVHAAFGLPSTLD
ncbi:sigma-70 family RNA polymerase sigma factor family protein [Actinokineospora bangkokensis]|uniref:Uncharacterized protein n=1 Tax=Actinokineospora bangkokensis TaxID=1193682 RepID=A0A1Q9LJ17_9PSEU|nr:hypothetical protein [Actinokineospora bangkokensis]OLR91995.1 hypothetical protein BJP25_24585 [Actinokineospora bangkokensis]